jgi:hypothetical protein
VLIASGWRSNTGVKVALRDVLIQRLDPDFQGDFARSFWSWSESGFPRAPRADPGGRNYRLTASN